MNIKHLLLALTIISSGVNAESVELKSSDDGGLLVNNSLVQLTKSIYSANGSKVENTNLVYNTLSDIYALVDLDEYTLLLNISIDGEVKGEYGSGNGEFEFLCENGDIDSDGTCGSTFHPIIGTGALLIYNDSLDTVIGITANSILYQPQAVYLKQDYIAHGVYIKGETVEGAISGVDSNGNQYTMHGVVGIGIEYNQSLTDALNTLTSTLKPPLFIK